MGFAFGAWFLLAVFWNAGRGLPRRREPYCIYLCLGALAGLLSIFFHSFTDFNLHIGANGLYFFFLAALAVSAANTRLRGGSPTHLGPGSVRLIWPRLVAAGLLLCCSAFHGGDLLGRLLTGPFDTLGFANLSEGQLTEAVRRARRAATLDPLEPSHHWIAAGANLTRGEGGEALANGLLGLRLDPADGLHLQRLGDLYSRLGDQERAERLFRAGTVLDPTRPAVHRLYGEWLLSQGEKDKGVRALARWIELSPGKTREFVALLRSHGLDDGEIAAALPARVRPHLEFADLLLQAGDARQAELRYRTALEHIEDEESPPSVFCLRISTFYRRQQRDEEALGVLLRCRKLLPDDVGIRLETARVYEKIDVPFRAIEEYEGVLYLDPVNRPAQQALRLLKEQ